jgi:hypothetical protein
VPVRQALALALVLFAVTPRVWAAGEDDEEESDEESDEEASDEEDADADSKPAPKASAPADEEEEEETDDEGLPAKQNLTGHDIDTDKKPNEFERDRFFVDKVDTEKTEDKTLVQGSIASSSFFYGESGGAYTATPGGTPLTDANNTGPSRMFTELRLQTDFRHISGGRWEARLDVRGRLVNSPTNTRYAPEGMPTTLVDSEPNRVQAGLYGENEYELREAWLIRSGKRSDVFIGRQFIPDLGGLKIDGLRVDYAKSSKLTLIGFGGLMPVRGSRSVMTDYPRLQDENGKSAGRFVAAGGFGGAYRSVNGYGALGGVIQTPVKLGREDPRVYVTSNGYLRNGAKLDVYHYILVDLYGSGAQNATGKIQLTNLSGGLNFKPNPRLRLTAAFHRVDTETLAVHAGAFLQQPDSAGVGPTVIQNEAYLQRIATNTARAGVSAGLGKQQRFELSTALSYRLRPEFTLTSPDRSVQVPLPQASSVEVWASFVDRHSIKGSRIGLDVSRSFAVGSLAYQRSISLISRLFVLREIAGGRGEWEAEASYSNVRDTVLGTGLGCGTSGVMGDVISDCYGTSNNNLYSLGGQVFYRLKANWMAIGTLHFLRITNKRSDGLVDPAVNGVTGFLRIAKRF